MKNINTRIRLKNDSEQNWTTAGNNGFIPLKGEIIIYHSNVLDSNSIYEYSRIKIGDGITNINTLPFQLMQGEDGYTPERGVDYWTEADKNEIKSYVDNAILNGAW